MKAGGGVSRYSRSESCVCVCVMGRRGVRLGFWDWGEGGAERTICGLFTLLLGTPAPPTP